MESVMQSAIQEAILVEGNLTLPQHNIGSGLFSCRSSLNQTSYRTTITGIEAIDAVKLVLHVQKWVESGPTVRVQWYIVDIDRSCPALVTSLGEPECGGDPLQQRCVAICLARGMP